MADLAQEVAQQAQRERIAGLAVVVRECSGARTPMLNVTEYLEQLFATGIHPGDLPVIQPMFQHRIWQQLAPGDGPTGSPTSSSSCDSRTTAFMWKVAAGPTICPGCAATTRS